MRFETLKDLQNECEAIAIFCDEYDLSCRKLDEYKRQMDLQERVAKILGGGAAAPSAGAPITPEQAIGMPGLPAGPTVQRAEMIGQVAPAAPAIPANVIKANQYRQIADVMVANNRGEDAKRYLDMAENLAPSFEETVGEPFRAADNNFYIRTKRGGVIPMQQPLAAKPVGAPQQVMGADRKPTLVQMYDDGTFKPITGVSPLIPPEKIDTGGGIRFENPYEIKPGTVFPKTISPQVVGGAETGYYIVGGGSGVFGQDAYASVLWSTGAYPIALGTNGAQRMLIDATGNVGIGVTPSAWATLRGLQNGRANLVGYVSNAEGAWLSNNAFYDGSWKYQVSSQASHYQQLSGAHSWHIAASGTAGNAITFTWRWHWYWCFPTASCFI